MCSILVRAVVTASWSELRRLVLCRAAITRVNSVLLALDHVVIICERDQLAFRALFHVVVEEAFLIRFVEQLLDALAHLACFLRGVSIAVCLTPRGQLRVEHLDAADFETLFSLRLLLQLLFIECDLVNVLAHHVCTFLWREAGHCGFFEDGWDGIDLLLAFNETWR